MVFFRPEQCPRCARRKTGGYPMGVCYWPKRKGLKRSRWHQIGVNQTERPCPNFEPVKPRDSDHG